MSSQIILLVEDKINATVLCFDCLIFLRLVFTVMLMSDFKWRKTGATVLPEENTPLFD